MLQLLQTRKYHRFPLIGGDDYAIRVYHRFLSEGAAVRNHDQKFAELCQEYPHAAQAHKLHYSPSPEPLHIFEARLLTDETFGQIAQRMGFEEPAVKLAAELFFDVRDRMHATDWIMKVVRGPPGLRSKFHKDGSLTDEQRGFLYRWFAYHGGPLVLDVMIAGIGGVTMPKRPDDVVEWLNSALQEIIRTRAIAAARVFEIHKTNAMQLIKLALPRNAKHGSSEEVRDQDLDDRMAKFFAEINAAISGNSTASESPNAVR